MCLRIFWSSVLVLWSLSIYVIRKKTCSTFFIVYLDWWIHFDILNWWYCACFLGGENEINEIHSDKWLPRGSILPEPGLTVANLLPVSLTIQIPLWTTTYLVNMNPRFLFIPTNFLPLLSALRASCVMYLHYSCMYNYPRTVINNFRYLQMSREIRKRCIVWLYR